MTQKPPIKVLFICMGNICRSPTAEGAFRKLVRDEGLEQLIHIDSAGTHAYHVGEAPDRRAQSAANNRDIDLSDLRGRQFSAQDFHDFDYLLAMDRDNYANIRSLDPGNGKAALSLMLQFAQNFDQSEVPDPYYGGDRGFEYVLDLIQDASIGLLSHIRDRHGL